MKTPSPFSGTRSGARWRATNTTLSFSPSPHLDAASAIARRMSCISGRTLSAPRSAASRISRAQGT